jgi:hypothetical protein
MDLILIRFDLTESIYEFELYYGINDAKSYSRYMICESGYFEYDTTCKKVYTMH